MRGGVTSQPANEIVICRAAGVTSGNVYTSFAAAIAASYRAGPGASLLIDGNVTAEAQAYNFTNLRCYGLGGGLPKVTFPNGASATFDSSADPVDFELRNVEFSFAGTSAVFIESPAVGMFVQLDQYAKLSTVAGGSKAFLHAASGVNLLFNVGQGCTLTGASGRAVVSLTTTASCLMTFFLQSTLSADTLTGGNAGSFYVLDASAGLTGAAAAASISHTQTGATSITFDP